MDQNFIEALANGVSQPVSLDRRIARFASAAAVLALVFMATATAAIAEPLVGPVTRVSDGDTITVGRQRVRLCGIQAPEAKAPGGGEAGAALRRIALGKIARCTIVGDGTPCDGRSKATSYDRVVATCTIAGVDLAAFMVKARQACDWPRFSGGAYGGPGICER